LRGSSVDQIHATHFAVLDVERDTALREMRSAGDKAVSLYKFDFVVCRDLAHDRDGLSGPSIGIVRVAKA